MLNKDQIDKAFKQLALKDYEFFLRYTSNKQWNTAKHLKYICKKLEQVEKGEIKRLIIQMPPRHGKSEITSKAFGTWCLMKNPEREIIIASYSTDISTEFSRIARNKFDEWAPQLADLKLAKDSSSVSRWGVDGYRGGCTAVGIGSGLTGKGANILMIDDYCKDWQDAISQTKKERTWDWYTSTARTRLAPDGAIVVIATPWTLDDLAGRLIQKMNDGTGEIWEIIKFPAIAEELDFLERKPGDTLWPERFDNKFYEDAKIAVGSKVWQALYQCDPSPSDGTIFKREWIKYYKVLPQIEEYIISVDATFKDAQTSDYVVIQCWGKKGAEFYLIDQLRNKMDFPTTLVNLRMFCMKHPRATKKLVEDKANGSAIIATLRKEIPGIIPINPSSSKIARAQATTPYFEAGNIYLPESAIWVGDYVEELVSFPNGKHDDQVDGTTQVLNNMNQISSKLKSKATIL